MYRHILGIFIFVLCSTAVDAQSNLCSNSHCMAVIDAGSTGSRLHLFSFQTDASNTPIEIREIWTKRIKPGFASIESNTDAIDSYLSILFSGSPKMDSIPVYFYATAGMRLLPQAKQKKYYDGVNAWFKNNDTWQLIEAKTITGSDEALYDWLSVNYHQGSFQNNLNSSVGVMDMGGASVQVVFPVKPSNSLSDSSQIDIELYGKRYHLLAHSFLGLGQSEVAHQFLNSASCFAENYPLPDGGFGQGEATRCEQEVSQLANKVHGVHKLIHPQLMNNPVDSWYAIGALSYLADSPLFAFQGGELTSQALLEQGNKAVCHQPWDVLNSQYPNDEYLYEYCLFSSYFYALMVDGYGIFPEQSIRYLPSNENVDWTIGVVLHPHAPGLN